MCRQAYSDSKEVVGAAGAPGTRPPSDRLHNGASGRSKPREEAIGHASNKCGTMLQVMVTGVLVSEVDKGASSPLGVD